MTTMKCAIHLPSVSGLPRDDVVNTLYFEFAAVPSNAQMDALGLVIERFYKLVPTGRTRAIKDYFAHDRDYTASASKVDFYTVPAVRGPYGPPVHTYRWTLTVPSLDVQFLPDQVATCMSYSGSLVGFVSPKRHKGRIFLGPLNTLALQETTGAVAPQTVSSTFNGDIRQAAQDQLKTAALGMAFPAAWAMWSPTDWQEHNVVSVSVDDRFDTQRRRLQRAGARSTTVLV